MSDVPSVLLVSPYLPPHIGGVERYVETIARELDRLDWRVVIAAPSPHREGIERLPGTDINIRYLNSVGRLSNTPIGFRWRTDLTRIIEEEKIDVVNAHTPVPGLADAAQRAAGTCPFVLTYHAGPMRKNHALVDCGLRAYERCVVPYTVRRSTFLICSSTYVRQFLETLTHSVPSEVIPPGVDVSRYSFTPYEEREGLLFVGSMERATRYKGLDDLLRAVALLRTEGRAVRLSVVGDGDARAEHEAHCAALGLGDLVTFHGGMALPELATLYQRAQAVVVPSRHDSFPTVIIEAMACGTPVIATRVGGIPTVVENERNGLLVEPGRPVEIGAAITRLLSQQRFAASLGAAGCQSVEESWTSVIQGKRTSDVLERAMARPQLQRRTRRGMRPTAPRERRSLLMIAPYFPPFVGGVEQYAWHLARALIATGRWDVTVLTTKRHGFRTDVSDEDGLRVVRFGAWGRYSYTPFSPLWPWQVHRYIKRLDPEVINAHTPVPIFADVAAWASGTRPFFLTYHAATLKKDAGRLFNLAERSYRVLERFTLNRTDAVLAVSDFVGETLRGRVKGKLVTFPNAVPAASLSQGPVQPTPGQFVFIARLDKEHRWKGLEGVLEAIALCPEARLKVAGDGDLRADYEKRAADLGVSDRVEFLGVVSGEAKDQLIGASSALIAYPTTSNDAFPTVLLEAWAARVPVVAADIGALGTLVQDGVDGFLVPPSEPGALAQTLTGLMKDPATMLRCGESGRNKMEHLTWEAQALRFEQLVESIETGRGC
ncbi:MAG: glycosyltransferase family 4 protein [Acidimicrobiales bacterium]